MTDEQQTEFFKRLEGPEGCDFKENEKGQMTWKCKGGNNKDLSLQILQAMGIPFNEGVEFLCICDRYGGHCDCEIIFNSKEHLIDE